MNPLTNMKNVLKLSERDLKSGSKTSWHDMYKDSAWIFVGGLPYDITEGDIIAVFSQYGEIVNINLIRDKHTGKSKGFCFICFEDQRSTVLTVDNLNGIKVLQRTIRVDHVSDYKPPKENDKTDEETMRLYMEGCAPKHQMPVENIKQERVLSSPPRTVIDGGGQFALPQRLPIERIKVEHDSEGRVKVKKEKKSKKVKKEKKLKKEKKSKKKKRRKSSSDSSSESSGDEEGKGSQPEDTERKDRRESRQTPSEDTERKERRESRRTPPEDTGRKERRESRRTPETGERSHRRRISPHRERSRSRGKDRK